MTANPGGLPVGIVRSLQVGPIRDYPGPPRPWRSGIAKTIGLDKCAVSSTGFDGDAQADLVHHGGEDKAVLMYAASHYPAWSDRPTALRCATTQRTLCNMNRSPRSTCCAGFLVPVNSHAIGFPAAEATTSVASAREAISS